MAVNIAFDRWDQIERDWSAWWAGELARPLVVVEGVAEGCVEQVAAAPDFTSEFGLDTMVIIADREGKIHRQMTVSELLPGAFLPSDLAHE